MNEKHEKFLESKFLILLQKFCLSGSGYCVNLMEIGLGLVIVSLIFSARDLRPQTIKYKHRSFMIIRGAWSSPMGMQSLWSSVLGQITPWSGAHREKQKLVLPGLNLLRTLLHS